MGIEAAIIGGSVVSGLMGSRASSKAAGAQTAASQMGVDEQRRQFDLTREDFAPYREGGEEALYNLLDYLGIGTGRGFSAIPEAPVSPDRADFMTGKAPGGGFLGGGFRQGYWTNDPRSSSAQFISTAPAPSFDQTGFDAAMAKYNADKAAYERATRNAQRDPRFGSLLDRFTGDDLEQEPGYQFGLNEGEKAIDRMARARGGLDSGATLKALLRFNNDYAGTKFNEGFNRDSTEKTRIFNMLSGVSGTGQTATGQVASAGTNASNNIANLIGQQGDARAAGVVGSNRAWTDAISNGLQGYQNVSMMNWLRGLNNPAATATGGPFGYKYG